MYLTFRWISIHCCTAYFHIIHPWIQTRLWDCMNCIMFFQKALIIKKEHLTLCSHHCRQVYKRDAQTWSVEWLNRLYLKPVSVGRLVTLYVCDRSSWLTSGAARSLLNWTTLTGNTNRNFFLQKSSKIKLRTTLSSESFPPALKTQVRNGTHLFFLLFSIPLFLLNTHKLLYPALSSYGLPYPALKPLILTP